MITAIINQLKTGTITNVYARQDKPENPVTPYVITWEDEYTSNIKDSVPAIFVSCHMNVGYLDAIDNYMKNEVIVLLHNKILTDSFGNNFELYNTPLLSKAITNNDDGSISKDRQFIFPEIGVL